MLSKLLTCEIISGYSWLKQGGLPKRATWHAGKEFQPKIMTSINSHLRNARKRMLRSSTLSSVNFFSKLRILFERSTTSTMQLWILHSTHTRANEFLQCSYQLVLGQESNTNQRRPSEWTSVRKVLASKVHFTTKQGGRSWQAFGKRRKCLQFFRRMRIC